jgi:hypothetical protein
MLVTGMIIGSAFTLFVAAVDLRAGSEDPLRGLGGIGHSARNPELIEAAG